MDLMHYQTMAKTTAIYPDSEKIKYPALGLAGEVGELCNKIKKIYRDHNGVVTTEMRNDLFKEAGDALWYLAVLCEDLEFDLDDVAEENLTKLLSRKDRGVIGGSGDDR
jgi:NTP pyrophosphatase (non-canonical NTP hydrolase)